MVPDARVRRGQSPQELAGATLEVTVHESNRAFEAGAAIDFAGTAIVDEPGWSLRVPFALSRLCSTNIDI